MLHCTDITVIVQSAHDRAQDQQAQTLAEAQAQVDKLREEGKTLKDQLVKQRQAADKADLELKNVEAYLAVVSMDRKQLESKLEATLASADKDKKQLESRLEATERDKKQLEARVLEGEADRTKFREWLGVVERELQQEREIIQALTQERDDLIGGVDWLEERIRERDVDGKEKDKVIQEWKGRYDIMKAGMGAPGKMLAEMAEQLMDNNRLLEAMTPGYKANGPSVHDDKQPVYK